MKHTFSIPYPNDVTLRQFRDFSLSRTDVGKFCAITGLNRDEAGKVPRQVLSVVIEQFKEMMGDIQENPNFPKIVTLDGTDYGFEPNLQRMSTAAWADIAHLEDNGKQMENLHRILAVLYRPVTHRWGVENIRYRIEDYAEFKGDAIDNADLFLDFKMCDAFGVLAFFLSLQKGLTSSLELKMMKELRKATEEMRKEICHI